MNYAVLTVISVATAYLLCKIAGLSIYHYRYWNASRAASKREDSTALKGKGSRA